MRAAARLRRTQVALAAGALGGALLWALAVGLVLVTSAVALDAWIGLPHGLRAATVPGAATSGALVAAARVWLARGARAPWRVALWIEERAPALRFALVTLAEQRAGPHASDLEAHVAAVTWAGAVRAALARAVLVPLAVSVVSALALTALPRAAVERVGRPLPGDGRAAPAGAGSGNRLNRLAVTVTPPAYTGRGALSLVDPAAVRAMTGSAVTVEGRGGAHGLTARLGEGALVVRGAGDGWRVAFAVPDAAVALRLEAAGPARGGAGTAGEAARVAQRIIVVDPFPDSLPVVILTAPGRDSVLRVPPLGALRLTAEVHDDLGVTASWFELVVSSGERESFRFRGTVLGRAPGQGTRDLVRDVVLPWDSLGLGAGDVVHLRAVASDGRVPGPGQGASDTRTWRIARSGEYDSLSVEGAPPTEGDTSAVSQRMLILLAEALERRRPRLERAVVQRESRAIARDQSRLRRRVADLIFLRLGDQPTGEEVEGVDESRPRTPAEVLAAAEAAASRDPAAPTDFAEDESPVVAVNRPLLEAYNAMWDATRELELGEPDDALPFMRAALAAIQRARQAERLYLRGRPPAVVVDLRRVRLAGDASAARPGPRDGRAIDRGARAALAARLERAVALLLSGAAADAADSLQLLRVDALGAAPRLAALLGEVVSGLGAGADVTVALLRSRAAVAGAVRAAPALPAWAGLP